MIYQFARCATYITDPTRHISLKRPARPACCDKNQHNHPGMPPVELGPATSGEISEIGPGRGGVVSIGPVHRKPMAFRLVRGFWKKHRDKDMTHMTQMQNMTNINSCYQYVVYSRMSEFYVLDGYITHMPYLYIILMSIVLYITYVRHSISIN